MAIVSALVSWLKLLEGAKNGSKSFPATMPFVNARACVTSSSISIYVAVPVCVFLGACVCACVCV